MFETTQYNPNNLDLEELLNFNFGKLAAILTPFVQDNTDEAQEENVMPSCAGLRRLRALISGWCYLYV